MAGRPKRGTKGGEKKVMRGNKQVCAEAGEADKKAPKAQGSRKQANKVEKVEIDNVDKALSLIHILTLPTILLV